MLISPSTLPSTVRVSALILPFIEPVLPTMRSLHSISPSTFPCMVISFSSFISPLIVAPSPIIKELFSFIFLLVLLVDYLYHHNLQFYLGYKEVQFLILVLVMTFISFLNYLLRNRKNICLMNG